MKLILKLRQKSKEQLKIAGQSGGQRSAEENGVSVFFYDHNCKLMGEYISIRAASKELKISRDIIKRQAKSREMYRGMLFLLTPITPLEIENFKKNKI